jgi:hypothetical protein
MIPRNPLLWQQGYAARVMDPLYDFLLARSLVLPNTLPDWRAGFEAGELYAEWVADLMQRDPLEFIRQFGRPPVNYDVARAHATVAASKAWRELCERQIEDAHLEEGRERDHGLLRMEWGART